MMQEFERMSAQTLGTADDDLRRIAETAQLSEAENERIAARVFGRLGLTPEQSAGKEMHGRKRRIRIIGALIAAVLTAGTIGLGVSGWMTYNKPLMQHSFGSPGDERLAAMDLPEPQTFTNGRVNATAEACLCDSNKIIALVTFESADPSHPYHWMKMMGKSRGTGSFFCYDCNVLDEDGNVRWSEEHPYGEICVKGARMARRSQDSAVFTTEITLDITDPAFDSEEITLRFAGNDLGSVDVTLPVTRLETVTLKAEDGGLMQLSPIGFRASGAHTVADERMFSLILHRSGGIQRTGHLELIHGGPVIGDEYGSDFCAVIYEEIDGTEYASGNPDSYTALIEVSDIESVEWLGRLYRRTEN